MKLRNKKTGDIVDIADLDFTSDNFAIWLSTTKYSSLAELNEEWEDYEETKGTYFINTQGDVQFWDSSSFAYPDDWTKEKEIGNYFGTKEEAEKAVEKLKAWKRLKDKGFRFGHWVTEREKKCGKVEFKCDDIQLGFDKAQKFYNDITLIFGGE